MNVIGPFVGCTEITNSILLISNREEKTRKEIRSFGEASKGRAKIHHHFRHHHKLNGKHLVIHLVCTRRLPSRRSEHRTLSSECKCDRIFLSIHAMPFSHFPFWQPLVLLFLHQKHFYFIQFSSPSIWRHKTCSVTIQL